MRVGSSVIPIDAQTPMRGLNTSTPSTRLEANLSPNMLNMLIRDGVLQRRGGYMQMGQELVGRVLLLVEPNIVDVGSGTVNTTLVAVTSRRQYSYDDSLKIFVDVTPDQVRHAIVAVSISTPSFSVAGDVEESFPEDLPFPVELSTDNDAVYTVVSAVYDGDTNTVITVKETMTSATVDGNIVTARDWTLTEDDGFIDYVVATDLDSSFLLITNGAELPRSWTGNITDQPEFVDWRPNKFEGFEFCKTLALHYDHLFLGAIKATNYEYSLVAWSDVGNFENFETGTSGAQILTDVVGEIKAMVPLGDRLVIYSEDSIITSIFVGLPAVFSFETVIPHGVRLSSPKSIVSINVGHVFPSEENLYLFDGTRGLRIVGEQIANDYKRVKNYDDLGNACGFNDYARGVAYFAFPNLDDTVTVYTVKYDTFNLNNMIWSKEIYDDNVSAFGFYTKRSELDTWEDTLEEEDLAAKLGQEFLHWEDEVGVWHAESDQKGYPARVFGSTKVIADNTKDSGFVFRSDESVGTDNGTLYTSNYDTPDFVVPQAALSHLGRWFEIEFEAKGQSVDVSYSTDQGRTFTALPSGTVTLTSDFTTYKLNVDKTSKTMRFRFEVVSGTFSLRWYRTWLKAGGPR